MAKLRRNQVKRKRAQPILVVGTIRSHQKVCVNGTVDFDPGRQFEFITDVKWTDLNHCS